MKGKWLHLGSVLMIVAALAIWSAPASAYIFGFDDMAYISSGSSGLTAYHTVFGSTAGPGNGAGAGFYQKQADTANGWSPYASRFSSGTSVSVEFIYNDPNGTSKDAIWLSNGSVWNSAGGTVNGAVVGYVTNGVSTDNQSGQSCRFSYFTGGGTQTAFTLNSFDLKGTGTVLVEGIDTNFNVVGSDTITLTSAFVTHTENWAGIVNVQFFNDPGIGNIAMDNVRLNEATVPIPPSALLLGTGLLGLVALRPGRKKKSLVS